MDLFIAAVKSILDALGILIFVALAGFVAVFSFATGLIDEIKRKKRLNELYGRPGNAPKKATSLAKD